MALLFYDHCFIWEHYQVEVMWLEKQGLTPVCYATLSATLLHL
jgi:hypothetical protein